MANLSHSVPKKAYYNGNGFGGDKAVYDDVFGGPPKFGVPTLSPRVEDYAEIFGSFHASPRASSIPVLDLPPFDGDEADFSFDSHFDYSQVFGGFNGLDFAISFEELFKHSKTTYDSSDEAWTPAQSESLSEESDPSACSERCRSLPNGGSHQSCDGIKQLNISYNKASQSSKDDMSTGMDHITQLHAVPGFTIVVNETPPPKKIEHRHTPLLVTDDIIANPNVDCSGALRAGKQFRKTMSLPSNSSFGTQTLGTDLKHTRYFRTASHLNEAFVTVSDISLRTRPSQLPPPLRPPPVFAEKDGECERQESKLTASKSSALGEKEGDGSPPFFDVEVDASSSAAVSAAAMKDAVEKAQAKLTSAKELMERKKEGLQSHTKLGLKNDAKYKKEKASRAIAGSDERAHGTCQRDCIGMQTFAGEERLKVMNGTEVVSYSFEGKKDINVGKISADKRHGKDRLSEGPHKTEATVAWRQAAQYYEVVETDQCRKIFEQAKGERVLVQNTQFRDPGKDKTATPALQQLEDDSRKIRDDREAHELDGNKGRSKATKESSRQEKQEKKVKVNQEVCEQVGNGKKPRMSQLKVPTEADNSEEHENLVEVKQKEHDVKVGKKLKEGTESIEYGNTNKDAHEREESERRLKETSERERYEKRLKEATERAEIEKRLKEALDREEREKQQREACEREEKEKRQKEAHEREENEKRLKEAFEQEENKKRLQEALERVETEKRLKMALEQEENEKTLKLVSEMDEKEKRLLEDLRREETEKIERGALQQEGNGGNQKEAHEREESTKSVNEACEREENEKGLKEEWGQDENKKKIQEAHEREDSEERSKEAFKHIETAERPEEANDSEETQKELKGHSKDHEQHAKYENGMNLKSDQATNVNKEGETFKASDGGVEVVNVPVEAHISGTAQVDPQHGNNQIRKGNSRDSLHLHDNLTKSVETGIGSRQTQMDRNEKASEIASNTEKPNVLTCELGERGIDVMEVELTFEKEETKDKFMSSQVVGDLDANRRKMGADQSAVLEEKRKAQSTAQKVSTCQNIERKGKNLNAIVTPEEREKEDRIKKERELEKDRLRKIEEEREREREREKDRMAVDKATLEARERVFAEARERAERAAVERATAEVRQRAMVEARERLEKASAEVRERSSSLAEKASMEARLRAERAAVERATAEARERAFQKAMNEKASFEARERVERSVVDKPSASCKNGGIRQCSSFSDLQDVQHQGVGCSSGSLYSYSKSFHGGVEGESAQRCKARLERHRRTAERAAKALAEKNMRDLLAQREQTERNRLAEALDAEVKRWSSGKEGNLRALLSTLQYILGPNSGWQPIPLTEVITSAAVKKAYRKATLCVHPDKLQQRGASIQQKYICEKVFDLLKESWNRFNSEER